MLPGIFSLVILFLVHGGAAFWYCSEVVMYGKDEWWTYKVQDFNTADKASHPGSSEHFG